MNGCQVGWWTIAHLQYPFCKMFHKATIYQGKEPCQLAPNTVGAYTTPSNFTHISGPTTKVLYVLVDYFDENNINNIDIKIGNDENSCVSINLDNNSLTDGKSIDILPSLKSVLPLSSSKIS